MNRWAPRPYDNDLLLDAWSEHLLTDRDCDGLYDDYVLELLRRDDHLDLDVQRDAWGLLYAELHGWLRVSEAGRTIPA